MNFFASWPFPLAVAGLFVIVMARANGTYWVGRGVRHGAGRTRLARLFATPAYRRAEQLLARWGAPAVIVSFLTVGVQTMINAAAGATRMPLRRYLPAVTVGCVVWAFVYASVGAVTIEALMAVHRMSPVAFWVLLTALVAVIVGLVVANLRRAKGELASEVDLDSGADPDPVGGDLRR